MRLILEKFDQISNHTSIILEYNFIKISQQVGFSASTSILNMLNNGLNIDTLHLVGHSLGAQMAGIIGREIQRKTKGEKLIRRYNGLLKMLTKISF